MLGLVREVVAASYFGVSGAMSAFTIAFQVPNLVRALFADSALQGAFVPVFTELLEKGERKEAFRVASSLFFLIMLVLGAVTALFVIFAEPLMSLFAPGFDDQPELRDLTVMLSQLMFPIVVLLALSGLVVGMLNSFEHFAVPALAPVAWNLVIIAALVGLVPVLPDGDEIYAYAIGILAGTVVQFLLPLPWLRGRGGHFSFRLDWRNPHVIRVLKLMLPVTLALGLINLSLLINSLFGTLVSDQAPAAIDKAFRIYQLPQGLFSISIATILFPTLSRFAARGARDDLRRTMGNGMRQICLLLIPTRGADGGAGDADHPPDLPARRVRRGGDRARDDGAASGGRSRCRSRASACCSPAPSSASSSRGRRPRCRCSTWSSTRPSRPRSTSRSGSRASCSARSPARLRCASRRAGYCVAS